VTDFLYELELQMTAAAHRAAAERARPPRVKHWPTVALVDVAAVAIAVMFLLPERRGTAPDPAKPAFVSLKDTRVVVYNAAGVDGLAASATYGLHKRGADTITGTLASRSASTVLSDAAHAAQAQRVARLLGIKAAEVPAELPDPGSYDIVVLLGQDLAPPARRLLDSFALLREATNRTVETPAGPVRVHATGAGLCLEVREGPGWGGTCVDVTDAVAGRTVFSIRAGDGRLRGAVGLVPDGIDAVELGQVGGTSRRLAVGRNLWAVGAEQVGTVSFDGKTITVP
jgi:hypothetical protein